MRPLSGFVGEEKETGEGRKETFVKKRKRGQRVEK